ncbi:MAG: hypothetical protein ACYTFY_10640 [Planctomycetota bacterium]|jgi:hypothetical protein
MNKKQNWIELSHGLPGREYSLCAGQSSAVVGSSGFINCLEYHAETNSDQARRNAVISNRIWRRETVFNSPAVKVKLWNGSMPTTLDLKNSKLYPFGIEKKNGKKLWRWHLTPLGIIFSADGFTEIELSIDQRWFNYNPDPEKVWQDALSLKNKSGYSISRHIKEVVAVAVKGISGASCGKRYIKVRSSGNNFLSCCIAFGKNFKCAERNTEKLILNAEKLWFKECRQLDRLQQERTLWKIKDKPVLEKILNNTPLFIRQLGAESGKSEICFRAASRGYGYFSGWDGIFSARLMLISGIAELCRKYLSFLNSHRGSNKSLSPVWNQDFSLIREGNYRSPCKDDKLGVNWSVCHDAWGVKLLEEYTSTTGDNSVLEDWWITTKEIFNKVINRADRRGFVHSCYVGPDHPGQACRKVVSKKDRKLTSPFTGSADMGIWYDGLCSVSRLAALKKDNSFKSKIDKIIAVLNKTLSSEFINSRSGWFYDNIDTSSAKKGSKHYFPAIWQLMSLQGDALFAFFGNLPGLVKYLNRYLLHSKLVLQMVPESSHRKSSNKTMIHNSWQNFFVEIMRLLRWTGESALIEKYVKLISDDWKKYRLVHENLFDLSSGVFDRKAKWDSLGKWMGMTSSTWWRGLLAGYAGIELTPLSISYIPCMSRDSFLIERIPFNNGICNLRIKGQGQWVKSFRLNGRSLAGTWQAVASNCDNVNIDIIRGNEPPENPVWVHSPDAKLNNVLKIKNNTTWKYSGCGYIHVVIYSKHKVFFKADAETTLVDCCKLEDRGFYCITLKAGLKSTELTASI